MRVSAKVDGGGRRITGKGEQGHSDAGIRHLHDGRGWLLLALASDPAWRTKKRSTIEGLSSDSEQKPLSFHLLCRGIMKRSRVTRAILSFYTAWCSCAHRLRLWCLCDSVMVRRSLESQKHPRDSHVAVLIGYGKDASTPPFPGRPGRSFGFGQPLSSPLYKMPVPLDSLLTSPPSSASPHTPPTCLA